MINYKRENKVVLLTLALLSFYIPADYVLPAKLYLLWEMGYIGVTLVSLIFLVIYHIKQVKPHYILFMMYYGWMLFGSQLFVIKRTVPLSTLLFIFFRCAGYITVLELTFMSLPKKKAVQCYLDAGMLASVAYFLSFILYAGKEGGMRNGQAVEFAGMGMMKTDQNWFLLTYDNESPFYFIPIAVALLYYTWYYDKKKKGLCITYFLILFIMYISKMAATALVAITAFTAGLLYYYSVMNGNKRKMKIKTAKFGFTYWRVIIVGFILNIFIVLLPSSTLGVRVAEYFGKDSTYSGRTIIWENCIRYIKKSLLFGNGYEGADIKMVKIGQTHCHNLLVEHLYLGGAILLGLFLLVIISSAPKRNDTFAALLFSAALFTFFLDAALDWLPTKSYIMAIFVLNYYLNDTQETDWYFIIRSLFSKKKRRKWKWVK